MLKFEKGWIDTGYKSTLVVHHPGGDQRYEFLGPVTVVPTPHLRLLWGDRADWLFYAVELERRGKWREP